MKKVILVVMIMVLCGCSALSYKSADKEVFFVSIGSADTVSGKLSKDETLKVNGQQGIDPAVLLQILTAVGAVAQ